MMKSRARLNWRFVSLYPSLDILIVFLRKEEAEKVMRRIFTLYFIIKRAISRPPCHPQAQQTSL